jgi:hydrogenase nickel incorporation protein HypA/HybF
MHELSLMETVRDLALEQAAAHGAGRITAITLRIGSLAGVEPEALRFAHQVVWAGTPAEGAALLIEEVAATCWCAPCAASFAAEDGLCACPRCGAISRELLRGRELELASLELAEVPAPPRP